MSLPPLWGQRAPSSPQVLERWGPEQLCPPLEIEKGIRARTDDTLSFALSSVLAGVSVLGRFSRVPHPREDTRAPERWTRRSPQLPILGTPAFPAGAWLKSIRDAPPHAQIASFCRTESSDRYVLGGIQSAILRPGCARHEML